MRSRPPIPEGPYLIVGLARSGTAVALALRARGEDVIGVDADTPPGTDALADAGVELHLRDDGVGHLARVHTVVKSPGVPAQAPVVAAARERAVAMLGELELAWRLLPNELIAVTGTNGKTTTVELIGHIHREAGLPVAVAGNVGAALSGLVGKIDAAVTVVCEASSFQLEDTLAFAPDAAVLLNLAPDHLDRHGTMAAYRAAKLRIFANQGEGDLAVVPAGPSETTLPAGVRQVRFGESAPRRPARETPRPVGGGARRVCFGAGPAPELSLRDGRLLWEGQPLLGTDELRLRGAHNVCNAMAAAAVCLARGIDPDAVRAGLRSFAGVAHRLEEVARRDGVLYVNDSKATNVASTLVALDAFPPRDASSMQPEDRIEEAGMRSGWGRVHLILGGQGKGQDFRALRAPVERSCRAVYLIGEDAPAIAGALENADVPVRECGELERAVAAATEAAVPEDVILLSPACASFDQFADFEARGERFRELAGQALGGFRSHASK